MKTNVFGEGKIALVQCYESCISSEPSLHFHHAVRHAGNIEGGDVEDLHALDESPVESASEKTVCVELFFESDQIHGRSHRVFGFCVLGDSDVNP